MREQNAIREGSIGNSKAFEKPDAAMPQQGKTENDGAAQERYHQFQKSVKL